LVTGLAHFLAIVYVGGMAISMLLFNYQYAREYGFLDWVVFGEIVPSLKATIWPYYLVRGLQEVEQVDVRLSDTRAGLHQRDIPMYYPILLDYIDEFGSLEVQWTARDADIKSLRVSRTVGAGILIETSVPATEMEDGTGPTVQVSVAMSDYDCDGALDRIRYTDARGEGESHRPEGDEWGLLLWDRCLGITFLYGEPFN
jgi:hypothetical protein